MILLQSIPLNQMLDWNPFPKGSIMGGGHMFNLAPSEWPFNMQKSFLAGGYVGESGKKKGYPF
jgi:hypothetical protein